MSGYDCIYNSKVEHCANEIMGMYKDHVTRANGCAWIYATEKHIYRRCLDAMRHSGLIKDYNPDSFEIYI